MDNIYNNIFETDNLTFVAVCMLQNDFAIKAVPHRFPKFAGHTAYRISPREKAVELFDKFQLDEIKLSPRLLNLTVRKVKDLPVERDQQ